MSKKPLSPAQRRHLQSLVDANQRTKEALDLFVAYLVDEHDAPSPVWRLSLEGFEEVGENDKVS